MDHFNYLGNDLYAEQVPIASIVAQYGSPCYIYSRATLEHHWQVFNNALGNHPHQICYAVKANSNIAVLNVLQRLGSGFDIVSLGELQRVIAAGGNPTNSIFSGVGKTAEEIATAIKLGIYCFNVESTEELQRINQIASSLQIKTPIALRINPNVDAKTHPHIATGLKENKFGIPLSQCLETYYIANKLPFIEIIGIACHIGSQITEVEPFLSALQQLLVLVDQLAEAGIALKHIDIGGGLGVRYCDELPPSPAKYAEQILQLVTPRPLKIILEPGRAIAANAGILVTKIEYIKKTPGKNFAIVDAAMNDLLRPALYEAYQEIIPVQKQNLPPILADVVGPVCETSDYLGKNRVLSIKDNDLLAVRGAGAYGFAMSSNYNSRGRVAEVMVDKDKFFLIREREDSANLFSTEHLLP